MKISKLENKLNNININKSSYGINSNFENEQYCIENVYGRWHCYYWEKGVKVNEKVFNNEDDACNYFYKLLSSDPTVRS